MSVDEDDEFTKQFVAAGSWINKEFLEDVLSVYGDVTVDDFTIKPAVAAGDNYLSVLYRTIVKYTLRESNEQQEKYLMMKGLPTNDFFLNLAEGLDMFRKEISIYKDCLPAMHRVLRKYFPPDTAYVGPDSYKCARENTLVMEDITVDEYKMAHRLDQLNFEHTRATLQTLARFHALSVKVNQENPEYIEDCAEDIYTADREALLKQFFESSFTVLAASFEKWGINPRYCQVLDEVGTNFFEKMLFVVRPSEVLNVLDHGDIWVNNAMYKYNKDGSILNCKLVDFQAIRFSSPALDLHYFFFTSVQPKVIINQMDELLEIYHDALTGDLRTIGVTVNYTLAQLKEEMRDRAVFGLLALVQILPVTLAVPPEPDEDDEVTEDHQEPQHPLLVNFKNPAYRRIATQLLGHMDKIGYLDEAIRRNKHITYAMTPHGGQNDTETQAATARLGSTHDVTVFARIRSSVWRILSQPMCE